VTEAVKKDPSYMAWIDDTRGAGGSDAEIMNDYNLEVVRYKDKTFSVFGDKDDVRDFANDYWDDAEIEQITSADMKSLELYRHDKRPQDNDWFGK